MLRHVEEIVDVIASPPVVIVAQSMTGPIGVELARTRREAVTKLILISPVGLGVVPFVALARVMAGPWLDSMAPLLVPRWIARLALRAAYGDSRRITESVVDEYWAPSQYPGFSRALRALVGDFAWSTIPDAHLVDVADRTLVLLGGRDRLVRGSLGRAERIFGTRATCIPDAGHALQEEYPEIVNDAILDFLGRPSV
jgi:pimeloyl-ACP methyl ester carboxylesterase